MIREKRAQAETLFAMGQVLLGNKKYTEAVKLTDYIPYLGLRGQIFADVAQWQGGVKGDPVAASALLAQALQPVREKPVPERVVLALGKVGDPLSAVGDAITAAA
ncbi:MAG: hypothetical protein OXT01_20210, partial [Rhodospirillaceae bacterium]|nr:hypothetical protein [Rhodospirillaceae bacterium]